MQKAKSRSKIALMGIAATITLALAVTANPVQESQAEEQPKQESHWYDEYGSASDYYQTLREKAESSKNAYQEFLDKYGKIATEDQKQKAAQLSALMNAPASIEFYEQDKAELEVIKQDCEKKIEEQKAKEAQQARSQAKSNNSSGNYSYPSGGGVLTKSKGVNYYNGYKETWYSQRVLPGGGLSIPGRHVGSDGVIRDGNGYIAVASGSLPYGTKVETSLGTGIVRDSGCASNVIDIYTNW